MKVEYSCSAFSVSKRHVHNVCDYIDNQKEHHQNQSSADEYEEFVRHYQQTNGRNT